MKIFELFEDVESDVKYNTDARKLINQIYNFLYENSDYKFPIINYEGKKFPCLPIREINHNYRDLIIIFMKTSRGGGFYERRDVSRLIKHIIVLNITGDRKNIQSKLLNYEVQHNLTHELQHYFDVKRYKNRDEPAANYDSETANYDEYYNNPAEFNACFHNIADTLINILRNKEEIKEFGHNYIYKIGFRDDFNEYLKLATSNIKNKRAFDNFNQKYKQKLLKRLYQLHKSVLNMIKM